MPWNFAHHIQPNRIGKTFPRRFGSADHQTGAGAEAIKTVLLAPCPHLHFKVRGLPNLSTRFRQPWEHHKHHPHPAHPHTMPSRPRLVTQNLTPSPYSHSPAPHSPASPSPHQHSPAPFPCQLTTPLNFPLSAFPLAAASRHPILLAPPWPTRTSTSHTTSSSKNPRLRLPPHPARRHPLRRHPRHARRHLCPPRPQSRTRRPSPRQRRLGQQPPRPCLPSPLRPLHQLPLRPHRPN